MSKLIAVWGSPNSGKTTLSIKVALELYKKNASVIIFSPDNYVPALPVVFPNTKQIELFSVGNVLSKTEILESEVLKNLISIKGRMNMGFLGYTDGENKFSYPKYDESKATALITVLKGLVDFVIVDCSAFLDTDLLSSIALKNADNIIRIVTAELKSVGFFSAQLPLYADPRYRLNEHIIVFNNNQKDIILPVEEAKSHYKNKVIDIPYSSKVRLQFANGELLDKVDEKKFNKSIGQLAEKVI